MEQSKIYILDNFSSAVKDDIYSTQVDNIRQRFTLIAEPIYELNQIHEQQRT